MNTIFYDLLRFLHVIGFVFMSIPLFNLIVVNERTLLGTSFNYNTDRYMENLIRHGAKRCFVFQATVLVSGTLLLAIGPLGIESLWMNWIILVKTVLLFTLMGLLSYVHLNLQPKIESYLAGLSENSEIPDDLVSNIKPFRVRRKKLATICLFLVITVIILGLQLSASFNPVLTVFLIGLAALFSWRVNKTIIKLGWI